MISSAFTYKRTAPVTPNKTEQELIRIARGEDPSASWEVQGRARDALEALSGDKGQKALAIVDAHLSL